MRAYLTLLLFENQGKPVVGELNALLEGIAGDGKKLKDLLTRAKNAAVGLLSAFDDTSLLRISTIALGPLAKGHQIPRESFESTLTARPPGGESLMGCFGHAGYSPRMEQRLERAIAFFQALGNRFAIRHQILMTQAAQFPNALPNAQVNCGAAVLAARLAEKSAGK